MISICIPVYEAYGMGVKFLAELIESILIQDFTDYEIVVSDNSVNDEIERYCERQPVRYFHNEGPKTPSANLNNAIDHAQGEIIKPMFADDYFVSPDTLQKLAEGLGNKHWAFCTSSHNNDRGDHVPSIHRSLRELALGENTYGCPSAMIFRKTDLRFDARLMWLMDCEFYSRMAEMYGFPELLRDVKVCVREWEGQISQTEANGSVRVRETEIVGNIYA